MSTQIKAFGDKAEIHIIPTENDDGALVVLFADTEQEARNAIIRIYNSYKIVQFSKPRLTDGRWHAAGTVQ